MSLYSKLPRKAPYLLNKRFFCSTSYRVYQSQGGQYFKKLNDPFSHYKSSPNSKFLPRLKTTTRYSKTEVAVTEHCSGRNFTPESLLEPTFNIKLFLRTRINCEPYDWSNKLFCVFSARNSIQILSESSSKMIANSISLVGW